MTIRFHYSTISSYRELPPRWSLVPREGDGVHSADDYLQQVDQLLQDTRTRVSAPATAYGSDLVATIFSNQAATHEVSSRHSATLIDERRALARRHLSDIQWRLDALLERRPLRRPYAISVPQQEKLANDLERQILDLEKQKRDVQVTLWRDTLELRQALLEERGEYADTRRRMAYLSPITLPGSPTLTDPGALYTASSSFDKPVLGGGDGMATGEGEHDAVY